MNCKKSKKLFREDIQGLRGIAVSAVILYHAEIKIFDNQFFSGGYLGVDIFFIISGFLITKILLNDYKNGSLSFLKFINSRIRRIAPALLFVILITSLLSWNYLLPSVLFDYAQSKLTSIFFISNYFFFLSSLNYYDFSSLLKPLNHTWSLSLEIQMYLLFFFFFLIIVKFQKKLLIIVSLILILSFIISITTTFYDESLSFYSFHSRIWEFMIGSITFLIARKFKNFLPNSSLFFLGFLLIFLSFFLFNKNTNHPSFLTIFPLIGVLLMILFIEKKSITNILVTNNLIVFIGQISYSLYLWHYPIFAISRNLNLLGGNLLMMLFVIFFY